MIMLLTIPALWFNPVAGCVGLDEDLIPTSDVQSSGWPGTAWSDLLPADGDGAPGPLESDNTIDESDPNVECGSGTLDVDFEVHLSNPSELPGDSACNSIEFFCRARKVGAGGSTGQIDLTIKLMQGATEIESFIESDIGTSFTTFSHTLTSAEVDAITNPNDLRIFVEARLCATDWTSDEISCEVAWVKATYTSI